MYKNLNTAQLIRLNKNLLKLFELVLQIEVKKIQKFRLTAAAMTTVCPTSRPFIPA
jgi:hypothetical protein